MASTTSEIWASTSRFNAVPDNSSTMLSRKSVMAPWTRSSTSFVTSSPLGLSVSGSTTSRILASMRSVKRSSILVPSSSVSRGTASRSRISKISPARELSLSSSILAPSSSVSGAKASRSRPSTSSLAPSGSTLAPSSSRSRTKSSRNSCATCSGMPDELKTSSLVCKPRSSVLASRTSAWTSFSKALSGEPSNFVWASTRRRGTASRTWASIAAANASWRGATA
mmetsp:Transcript_129782/g.276977  ORF Transcript_129782/g.276977 Transcript_129782/m.276977 type:complete len:225 (+) Transcript_129782:454-1128(+)